MAYINEDNEDKKDLILELVILVPCLGGMIVRAVR